VLAVIAVPLYHLSEVRLFCEHILDALPIEPKPVSRKLETVFFGEAVAQIGEELIRGSAVTLAHNV